MAAISDEAAAEFRGLFFGEGHADLMRSGRGTSLVPRLRIAVRDDGLDVLAWCRALFGGSIGMSSRTRSGCWVLTGKERVGAACHVLKGGTLPSKKRAEIDLVIEALSLVSSTGVHVKPASRDRLFAIREELKALRAYAGEVRI